MLKGLSNQDIINKSLIQQNSELERVSLTKKNPYSKVDKNLLIDETNISNEAISLCQRDLDIKKFSSLAMSDPENLSHNELVVNNVFSAGDEKFDNTVIEAIFDNKAFLRDLIG